MPTCHITGSVLDIGLDVGQAAFLCVTPVSPHLRRENGATLVLPSERRIPVNADGSVAFNIVPGPYWIIGRTASGMPIGLRCAVVVPNEAMAGLGTLVDLPLPPTLDAAMQAVLDARAWAEGTLPGGPGTKSSREYAESIPLIEGPPGPSAYAVALANGFAGTEEEWLASLIGPPGSSDWSDIENLPSAFPPEAHDHVIADIAGLVDELAGKQPAGTYASGAQGALADTALQPGAIIPWGDLSGVPMDFPAAQHVHPIADITGLAATLDGKADAGHLHVIAHVTGLQAALDGKQPAGSYAPLVHTHPISDVTGLQAALDGKAPAVHTHTAAQISDSTAAGRTLLTAADAAAQRLALSVESSAQLDTRDAANRNRANHTGTQAIATVTGLQAALDGKAPTAAGIPAGGAVGQVLVKTGAPDYAAAWQALARDAAPNVQEFTTPGTTAWIKPTGPNGETPRLIHVVLYGGGGGGASGAVRADSTTTVVGGSGGGCGGRSEFFIDPSSLGLTVSVIVGAGGAGGAARAGAGAVNAGSNGGASAFGSMTIQSGRGGTAGGGGTGGMSLAEATFGGTILTGDGRAGATSAGNLNGNSGGMRPGAGRADWAHLPTAQHPAASAVAGVASF